MRYLILSAIVLGSCATTGNLPLWSANQSSDPVTGERRCVVTAQERIFGGYYSSVSRAYPVVEVNSEHGLMVGVSLGDGSVKYSPGDIIWRVDENEPRTLLAAETPKIGTNSFLDMSSATPEQKEIMAQAEAMSGGLLSSLQNGVTLVKGERAREMLDEMKAGSQILYRGVAPSAGLYSGSKTDYAEIPIDDSFYIALAQCGID